MLFAAAALTLGACNTEPEVVVAKGPADPMAEQLKNAPPVELPKPIVASHSYRCKDNSLLYVDWLAENSGANVRTVQNSASTPLKPGAEGPPFTAEGGYSLTGTAEDSSINVTLPEKASQTCRRA